VRGAEAQLVKGGSRSGQGGAYAWILFFAFVALYVVTLLPGVLPADSGEFQWVAARADVAHPPGYPLYSMAGWLFSQVPLGPTAAWRVNLFSAVTAAATVALVFSTVRELTGSILGGWAAALTLGSATTFWATATKTSIRPLTAFFAALCFYAVTRHASKVEETERPGGDRYLVLFSLALSLGITHHPSLAFPGAVFVLYLILVDPALLRQPDRWLKPAVALLPSVLVFVYLPFRGGPRLATVSGFLDHVLARGFSGDMFALGLLDRLVLLPTLLGFQFNWALVAGAFLGAMLLLWEDRRLAFLLIGSFLVHTAVTLTYDAPQTVEYQMPAYVSLVFLVAVPFGYASSVASRVSAFESPVPGLGRAASLICRIAGIALLAAAVINLLTHLPSYRALSGDHDTRRYVQSLLRDAPEDAVILANWHWFTPLRYAQQVEGARPDLLVDYVAPRGEPLAETWVHTIEEHIGDRPVVVVRFFEPEYGALPYSFEPLGEAFLVRSEPRTGIPRDLVPLDAALGGQIEVLGYRLSSEEARPARPLTVELAWTPASAPTTEIAVFAQLIGPEGALWSTAEDPRHSPEELLPGEVVLERIVVYPRLHASPGPYSLVVGAYLPEGRLTTNGGSDVVPLATVDLQPSITRPVSRHPRLLRSSEGPSLIGVDYDTGVAGGVRTYLHWTGPGESTQAELRGEHNDLVSVFQVPSLERGQYATVAVDRPDAPARLVVSPDGKPGRQTPTVRESVRLPSPGSVERYVPFGDALVLTSVHGPAGELEPGSEVTLSLRFRAQRPLQRDYIVSTSLTGLNPDGTWAWRASHDTVPGLGAVPTLKWIRGSTVLDPHRMGIPQDVPRVPAMGSLLIYDHFTQRSLPNLDERLEATVRLGTWGVSQ